jgi:Zn-dependent M28 family amino/carboxypeptidase
LQRLIARGNTPQLEIKFGGGFSPQSTLAYNLVAEIRGTELPDEMVILGVHQDSWDLASGATDNGVGVVLAMEVLRTLRASQLPMKRSLRIVLFSGEEQGLLGSRAYVVRHAAELEKIQAMLTIDSGAGRIIGFPDMQVDAWYTALTSINNSVKELNQLDMAYGVSHGSDHESFFEKGIPAFSAMQEPLDYLTHTWHSEVDSVDHVKPEALIHNAKILSLLSYALLNAEKLPHQAALK